MTENTKEKPLGKFLQGWQAIILQALLFAAFLSVLEFFFHIIEHLEFTPRFVYPIIFSIPVGFFCAAICSLFPKLANCILSTVIAVAVAIWFCVQICYSGVFMTYMEVSKITMAGDVAEGFGYEMTDAIVSRIPGILVVFLVVVLYSLALFFWLKPERKKPLLCGVSIVLCLVFHLICKGAVLLGGEGAYSPADMYTQFPRILDNNIETFGVFTSLRLEVYDMIFEPETHAVETFASVDTSTLMNNQNEETSSAWTRNVPEEETVSTGDLGEEESEELLVEEPAAPEKLKNVLEIDMEALIAQETDEQLLAIHQYVNSLPGSNTNEYTGYFEGYNLIMICAESFTSYMISEELTPTLYKLSNNGFVFTNYYGMFKSITTNGEYAFCTGLVPNTVGRTNDLKTNSTFLLSSDKYLPYCMGNVFESLGVSTYAYHSNTGSFYKRNITHPNMGYTTCRFLDGSYVDGVFSKEDKLVYSTGRPNSDEETALQTLGEYLDDRDENGVVRPFHAYYMTYSGHHPYHDIHSDAVGKNPMTFKNRDRVNDLDYSEVVKSYLAANLELEDMLTAILDALEEAGCLENTVIVLTNDHYPYGLQSNRFNELAGEKVETAFGIYENVFICYNAGMDSPVTVDTPCCTVDILPTLLNLFGYDYDSRLLAGTDVLDPNSFHIAMLYNQSFVTDMVQFNASKGKATYLVPEEEIPKDYLELCIAYVRAKFEVSLQIVKNDYYRVFYEFMKTSTHNSMQTPNTDLLLHDIN